ncbi:MAG TPA: hypothetical protein VHR45_05355 [Thermoanaerobaculia bacterium]|nr:hypothetical protein [Thermoanaerobaculia bacterium]
MRDHELSSLLVEFAEPGDLPDSPAPAAALDPAAAAPQQSAATDGAGPDALLSRLVQARAALEHERALAPSLCSDLLASPAEEQLERIAHDRRFQTWGVSELLLDKSQRAEERDPPESGRLASLALAAVAGIDTTLHLPAVAHDLRARIWGTLGEAQRRTGKLKAAEDSLRQAASCLAQGTGDLLIEARLLEFEAAVRHDQGRGGEAAALLKQAASRYLEVHEFHLLARVVARREQLLREAPRPTLPPRFAWRPACLQTSAFVDPPPARS